ANDGSESTTLCEYAHVDVDQEQPDGNECGSGMHEDGEADDEDQVGGHVLGKPHDDAGDEHEHHADLEAPEEHFLAGVVTASGRHLFILVADVVIDRLEPGMVDFRKVHLGGPHAVHLHDGHGENNAEPGMKHAGNLAAAKEEREPEEPRRPEG